jgi:hypothetical protein
MLLRLGQCGWWRRAINRLFRILFGHSVSLGVEGEALFAAVEKRVEWLVEEGRRRAVAITAWAFATLGVDAPLLFAAVDKRGAWLVMDGTPQFVPNGV